LVANRWANRESLVSELQWLFARERDVPELDLSVFLSQKIHPEYKVSWLHTRFMPGKGFGCSVILDLYICEKGYLPYR
jgi:hypothetical protein